jgi:hypothetical protein
VANVLDTTALESVVIPFLVSDNNLLAGCNIACVCNKMFILFNFKILSNSSGPLNICQSCYYIFIAISSSSGGLNFM